MGRILLVVMGLSIVAYLGYRSMYGGKTASTGEAPKQRLENVQKAADRIEVQQQQAADEALKRATPGD